MPSSGSFRIRLGAVLIAVALLVAPSAARQGSPIRPLGGIAEMKSWFNANQGHARVIFLLSPT
jgi:hypothetical protein